MKFSREFLNISIRYLVLILLSLNGLWIFYEIFTPLTAYPFYFIFNYFFEATLNLESSIVFVNGIPIELIKACIAGSAYYLLLIFNLSTPKIELSQRIKMVLFSFLIFLTANILRISLLTVLYMSGSSLFAITHLTTWYIGSVVLVIAIWFYQVKAYKIKEIPIYSDLKFLYQHSLLVRR